MWKILFDLEEMNLKKGNVINMELKELYKKTLQNASTFVVKDIQSKHNKSVFTQQVKLILNDKVHFDTLEDLIIYLEDKIDMLEQQHRWYHFSDDNKFQVKANELALDVAKSFVKRFVTGGEGEGQALL